MVPVPCDHIAAAGRVGAQHQVPPSLEKDSDAPQHLLESRLRGRVDVVAQLPQAPLDIRPQAGLDGGERGLGRRGSSRRKAFEHRGRRGERHAPVDQVVDEVEELGGVEPGPFETQGLPPGEGTDIWLLVGHPVRAQAEVVLEIVDAQVCRLAVSDRAGCPVTLMPRA
jgi:hypothetical protein